MKKTVAMQMPGSWSNSTESTKANTPVSARVDMSADVAGKGLCPVCKQPMEEGFADGQPVRFCREDLVTLPLSNEELKERGHGPEEKEEGA